MPDFPCWLSPKNFHIAKDLIKAGFHYCGNADEFCELFHTHTVGDWVVGFPDGECFIDVECDKALFSKSLEDVEDVNAESEFKAVKSLIIAASTSWEHESINHVQLSLC